MAAQLTLPFTKMHGLGNDFVVVDRVSSPEVPPMTAAAAIALSDRHRGVGADQVLVVEPGDGNEASFRYLIYNAGDGAQVEQCGNGARCFAKYIRDAGLVSPETTVLSAATIARTIVLHLEPLAPGTLPSADAIDMVTVDMGPAVAGFEVAIADGGGCQHREAIAPRLPGYAPGPELLLVDMGNPHGVWVVDDVLTAPVSTVGPKLERHPVFPARANIGFVQVIDRSRLALRVYERSASETQACGSGACAAAAACVRAGLVDTPVRVYFPLPALAATGVDTGALNLGAVVADLDRARAFLDIAIDGDDARCLMTGPAASVFCGSIRLDATLFESA
ncbi:diaminopimelate epimerase [Thecamonas trahens ATCC 50062]|uniref:Diaminopimelate epimerase n=1 Tax=Thecamonas trahens ATCC 50062 TaxID=461836 RepID=A0A0L0D9P5_THETB|nr:diaminopimelate epimerase [Thecamonas trahens ATCC 50062]KNC48975.1 diaminopimelate epimerase [Thecamonas trahens ATCC 50062]|eukprot:XP_013758390.1 diaminopimelate epimerase [Thecamonas trahens ATCC 50062]